jgi:phosphonate transport system permease protein
MSEESWSEQMVTHIHHVRRQLQPQIACFVIDMIAVFYAITMASYSFARIVSGQERFLLMPWWLVLIVAFEIALLWETFGISFGMRFARVRLVRLDGAAEGPRIVQCLVRVVALHLLGLPLVGLLAVFWSRQRATLYDLISGTAMQRTDVPQSRKRAWYRTSTGIGAALLGILTLTTATYITEIKLVRLFTGASRAGIVVRNLVRPDWSILGEGLGLLVETLFMSLLATLFGVVVAAPLSFLAARNLSTGPIGRLVYLIVRVIMSITRSIEPLIWAVIFVLWVRLGTFPGMLALWVHSIADLTKLYSEQLESIDQGPVEAIRATGAGRLQVILYGIVPQIVNPYLSFTLYRWDINVRMATIIGIVAGGGIGQQLYLYTRYWEWRQAATFMLLIMGTVWVIDYVSARLRARLEAGTAGKRTSPGKRLDAEKAAS